MKSMMSCQHLTRKNRRWQPGGCPLLTAALPMGMWLLCAWAETPLRAQGFSIDWYKITAGGGTSTNGQYNLTGAIGQHDAGQTLSGGNFALTGGFWSFITAVQTPGAPTLTVTVSGPKTVIISWPAPSTGFVLQQNSTLGTTTWVDVTSEVTTIAGVNQVEVPFSIGNLFFRLLHP